MAATIEVNTGTLRTDIDSINSELKILRQDIVSLRNVAASLGNTWSGRAKDAFMVALNDDIGELERLVSELEKYTTRTNDVRAEYDSCENTVAQIISSIRV